MKYIPILISLIVLILFIGLVFAFMPRSGSTVGYYASPYQASLLNTTAAPAPVNMVNMAYPYPNNTYGTVPAVPIVPVVWYTSPSQNYTYLYGGTQTYSYRSPYTYSTNVIYPGYSNGQYQYQYSNQQSATAINTMGGMTWYQ